MIGKINKMTKLKVLSSILLLTLCVSMSAQNWKRGLAVVGYHTVSIAMGAIADAKYDMGYKDLSHILHGGEIAMVASGPFVFGLERRDALPYLLSYCFLRFSFFDSFYNMTRDLPLLYNGTTSGYDDFMNTIPPHGRAWYKSISLIVGFSIPIKHL